MTRNFFAIFNKIKKLIGINADIGYVSAGQVLGTIFTGLFWLYLIRILPISDYGEINYLLSVAVIASSFSLFGLSTTSLAYIPKSTVQLKYQINSFALLTTSGIALVTFFIFQTLSIPILIISTVFSVLVTTQLLAERKYKEYAIITIVIRVSQAIFLLVFYFIFESIEYALMGFGVGALPFCYKYFLTLRFFSLNFNEIFSRIKFVFHGFSLEISKTIMSIDKLLIAPLYGFVFLAQYQIGIQFLLFVDVIPNILFHYLLPESARGQSNTRLKYLALGFSFIVVIVFWITIPSLVEIFFPKYIDSVVVIQIIISGLLPLTITSILRAKLLSLEKSKYISYGIIIFLTTEFVGIIILGNFLGVVGLAYSIILAILVETVYLFIVDRIYIANR